MDPLTPPATQTPDMQSAVGQVPPPPMTGPSVLSALGSMQGPDMGLSAGSGMLAALAGRPTQNPYLQQHAVAQEGAIRQVNQARLAMESDAQSQARMQQLQLHMQELAVKRDDATRTVLKDMLFGPHALEHEGQRAAFSKQYANSLGGLGISVPESMLATWAKGGPSQESQKNLALQLAAADAEPDAASKGMMLATAQKYFLDHGGKPEDYPVVAQNLRNPAYLESVKIPSPDKLRLESLKVQEAEAKAITAKYPELSKGDPAVIQDMIMQHRKYNGGKSYTEGTPESQQMAYDMAKYNKAKADEAKLDMQYRLRADLQASAQGFQAGQLDKRLQAQMDMLDKRLAAQAGSVAKQKTEAAQAVSQSFLNQLKAIVPQMNDKGFLPQSEGWISDKVALGNRTLYPNDAVLREWYDLQANMIGWARGVQNDIGPRAMAAFHETNRIMSQPPTKAGMERIIKNMEAQLEASLTKQPQPAPNIPGGPAQAPAPGTRTIRVKDSNGQPGTLKLAPGEAVPPGYTEIK